MRDKFVRVAAVTPKIKVGDVKNNVSSICDAIGRAADAGAKIIVLPELCVTGATAGDLFLHETLLNAAKAGVLDIAERTKALDSLIFVGAPLEIDGGTCNCAVVISRGKILSTVVKDTADRHFCPKQSVKGGRMVYAEVDGNAKLEIMVAFEDEKTELCAAPVMVIMSARPDCVGRKRKIHDELSRISRKNKCAVLYACAGYGESTTDFVFTANNAVYDDGKLLTDYDLDETAVFAASVSLHSAKDGLAAEENDACCEKTENTELCRYPFVPEDRRELLNIISLQAKALATRIERSGAKASVIGLSGGLDSTLALTVAVHAYKMLNRGLDEIVAVTMPCFGTTHRTKSNAEKLAEAYGVDIRTVDIGESVKRHLFDIGHDGVTPDVTYENAQARERTQVLMDLANMRGGMVIGTGDLSEMALGWATYNGDHMSMYSVNCSVPKTLVRALVNEVMTVAESGKYAYAAEGKASLLAAVLRDILDTPVSPELTPAKDGEIQQKTEDLVGPYELHDFFIYNMLVNGYGTVKLYRVAKQVFPEYDKETIEKWLRVFIRRFFAQQFKRSCVPDGPKVTELSLSPRGSFMMPSDASASAWLDELDETVKEDNK